MRAIASGILILSLLAQSLGKTAVLVHFYAFRKQIAEKECINKIRPVTMCYGSCYLAKKMKEDTGDKKSTPLPASLKMLKETQLFQERVVVLEAGYTDSYRENHYAHTTPRSTCAGIYTEIFHPPSC